MAWCLRTSQQPVMVAVIIYQLINPCNPPLGYLILERHDDAANEWGTLGSRDLTPSAIYYEPLIISRTV